jgi:hypothetical protein
VAKEVIQVEFELEQAKAKVLQGEEGATSLAKALKALQSIVLN